MIDVAFGQVRPSPWRQAVDLANMMLVLALRSDAELVYQRACLQFSVGRHRRGVRRQPRHHPAVAGRANRSSRTVAICWPIFRALGPPAQAHPASSGGAAARRPHHVGGVPRRCVLVVFSLTYLSAAGMLP